jgi:hypothetical protein
MFAEALGERRSLHTEESLDVTISFSGETYFILGTRGVLQKIGRRNTVEPGEQVIYREMYPNSDGGGTRTQAVVLTGRANTESCYVIPFPQTVVGGDQSTIGHIFDKPFLADKNKLFRVIPKETRGRKH